MISNRVSMISMLTLLFSYSDSTIQKCYNTSVHGGDLVNYYIGDLHLFHENAIKFDNRPFKTMKK